VTGVQTCALPICIVPLDVIAPEPIVPIVAIFLLPSRTTALFAAAVPAVIPSSISISASVNTALPIPIDVVAVRVPPETIVPETSKFALTSTRVAFNSISSVALMSRMLLRLALQYFVLRH